jgi:diguanylate cyclase (GGDEF)-like protein
VPGAARTNPITAPETAYGGVITHSEHPMTAEQLVVPRASRVVLRFGVLATACIVTYALDLNPALTVAAHLTLGLTGCVALFAGPRLHRSPTATPWWLLGGASVFFLVGSVIRPWSAAQSGLLVTVADGFTVPAYGLLLLGFAALLRARHSFDQHAVADGVIVSLGAGLGAAILLAFPVARLSDRPVPVSVLAALYPLLDVVLLLLLVNLAFSTAVRQPSFRFLGAATVLLLAGDIGYAVLGLQGRLTGPAWMDLPFLIAYALIGASALHPSMIAVGSAVPRPVQGWSWHRLVLLGAALLVPFALLVLPGRSGAERIVLSVGGGVMVVVVLLRAASAVQAYGQAQEVFRYRATHDGLTGLPNRIAFTGSVDRLLDRTAPGGPPLWLFFIDLDDFKLINDSWGHDAGDLLLAQVARRLRATAPPDALVARLGGDEFVVASATPTAAAAGIADSLMAALAEPLSVGETDLVISGSMGLACTTGADTAGGLMRDADTAMYRAKAEGRHCWIVFDLSMRQRVRERAEIEQALREAMNRHQLRVAYQPIVRLPEGDVVGAEALIRWDHPVRGPIPPATFIPIAEETGMIGAIGAWVLAEAVRTTADWRRTGIVPDDFWISVNVSPRQLRSDRMLDLVRVALAENDLPPSALVLEITESVMLDQSEVTERVLVELRGLGVRLAVDDFGTGFSALGYLRRHPVTGVKIDRGFVDGLGRDPQDEEIVRAVVAMSSALGLSVVAEGVETPAQCAVLVALGVVLGQGYLWGKAVRPAEFAAAHGTGPGPGRDDLVLARPLASVLKSRPRPG